MPRAAALLGLTVVDQHATELARRKWANSEITPPRRSWWRCDAGSVVRRVTGLAKAWRVARRSD